MIIRKLCTHLYKNMFVSEHILILIHRMNIYTIDNQNVKIDGIILDNININQKQPNGPTN